MTTGYIHSYESFATLEGYGIRFAVFMQGCNLRCVCCHNPETWAYRTGEQTSPAELVKKVLRYKTYFRHGGGVTFTGGEPLMQTDFLLEACRLFKKEGINITIDTSCSVFNDKVRELYSMCDLVIVDLKYADGIGYKAHCGLDVFNKVIATLDYLQQINVPVWIRTVIIPGINDSFEFVRACTQISKRYKNVERHELKPFHTMGFSKYEDLKIPNPLKGYADMDVDKFNELNDYHNALLRGEQE